MSASVDRKQSGDEMVRLLSPEEIEDLMLRLREYKRIKGQLEQAFREAGSTAFPESRHDAQVLVLLALIVPKRLFEEEVGDALEVIAMLRRSSASAWTIRTKVASTIFWVLINALRESMAALLGKKKGGG